MENLEFYILQQDFRNSSSWALPEALKIKFSILKFLDHPLARTARAMRSFTESIDIDMPPAPELPPALDIDHIGSHGLMKTSDTNDTIIEVVGFLFA